MNDLFLTLAQAPGRAHLLRPPAGAARRHPQRHPAGAPQGQARQPVQRVGRDRVRERGRLAARRRGPGRRDDHRDGVDDPARLRAGLGVAACASALSEAAHHVSPPQRVRRPAGATTLDADGDRGPRAGVRGRHRAGPAPGRGRRPRRAPVPAPRPARGEVLGVQAGARGGRRGAGMPGRQRLRRGFRAAAAATARRRSTRSGRARATSPRWTCCARSPASPTP